jgi:formyltetrahydrofolate synthetase
MKSDLEIAQAATQQPIWEIAEKAGVNRDELELFGDYKAKVKLEILDRLKDRPQGKYILVTAITPTPLGEGKTVSTIGLTQGLGKIGKNVITCIRQPSMGPVFGIKGGAAGGGYSQVIPMEDFNLHLTGDIHAITAAHNLIAAFLDTSILKGNPHNLDPLNVNWRRVLDISDRALRDIVIGLGGRLNGYPRQTGFDITVASEIMAILALTSGLEDMRERIGKIVVGFSREGTPVTTEDLKVAGSATVLMKDAIKPNLMQTLEGQPAFVHAGPFANIAHGNSSIVADQIALRLADYVTTEAGFGADCGAEKFFNVKCRASGLVPNAVGIVATVRALKNHSGKYKVVAGKPMPKELLENNPGDVEEGGVNLAKHIENVNKFGVPAVVIVNRFEADTDDEVAAVKRVAEAAGAEAIAVSDVHAKGGDGGCEVAEAMVAACEKPSSFKFLYDVNKPLKDKIETVAKEIYGAKDVSYTAVANRQIKTFEASGFGKLPLCMAKTHLSISHDPKLLGRPEGFTLPVREVRASVGAGFVYPLCGAMSTMPGLPTTPAGTHIDIDLKTGKVVGLF